MFKDLLTPETFEFFARYLLAGYIIIIVRSRFVLGRHPKAAEFVVEAIILSLLNQLAFAGAIWLSGLGPPPLGTRGWLFFAEIVALPILFGLLLGWNLSRGWNHAILRRLSMPVVHPVHRAHDFAFGVNRAPGFVEITYRDGTKVFGWFGKDSLASTDDERSDLYLERMYNVDDHGIWTEFTPPRSVLVKLQDVRSIEFLEQGVEQNGGQ